MRAAGRFASLLVVSAICAAAAPACSQGEGEGRIIGRLNVPGCWTGPMELDPDFFAAVPYRESLQIRIQNGSDFQSFSDGVSIMLYDINKVRPDPTNGFPGRYKESLAVSLPPEVTPPGIPVKANPNPAPVSLTLYLQRSCRIQNTTLHAIDQVTVPTDGSCDVKGVKGADPSTGCDPEKEGAAGSGSGKSAIAFTSIFNGRVDESAAERLTAGCFDVYLADPREVAAGGQGPPPLCRGRLRGTFSFYFERGRPTQPFP